MSKFTPEQIKFLERKIIMTEDGLGIQDVDGPVWGDVFGNVEGNVFGKVAGNVVGNVVCSGESK
jgi:hypothetical protein